MPTLRESLTGAYTEEYTLISGCEPKLKQVWTYEDELAFLNDIDKLRSALGDNFILDSWRVSNNPVLGRTITFSQDITLDFYIRRRRKQIQQGDKAESDEE